MRLAKRKSLTLAVAAGLIAVTVGLVAAGPPLEPPGLQQAIEAQERHTNTLLAKPGVVGTVVGLTDGGKPAVLVLTLHAGVSGIPAGLDGVPVRILVTGEILAQVDPTALFDRPVPIGVSTGHPAITAGTIGARVTDGTNVYALSNNHIYANENQASIGDNALQPGPFDGGVSPADAIGTLADYEPIVFKSSPRTRNTIDAAIVLSSPTELGTALPQGGYGTPSSTPVEATLTPQMAVQKFGRTTQLTIGTITGINATVNVTYSSGRARFVDQLIIEGTGGSFSAGGDSGSLIVTDPGKDPVGLLFAGNSTITVANQIQPVLARFGVTIDGSSGASEPTPTPTPTPAPTANEPPVVVINSPADGAPFGSSESVSFGGTTSDTEDGDLTASLAWSSDLDGPIGTGGTFSTTLSDGTHAITASATDSGSKTGSDSITIVVGSVSEATKVIVDAVTYTTAGGKNSDKHLNATVALLDDLGGAVSGASVSIRLDLDEDGDANADRSWTGAGTTGSGGTVIFTLNNAPSGNYTTTVTNVTAQGLSWDGVTPAYLFPK